MRTRSVIILLVFSAMLLSTKLGQAAYDCGVPAASGWSETEVYVWNRICAGQPADLNGDEVFGGVFDLSEETGWSSRRILRSEFLREILLREPFRDVIPAFGVRIAGAWISGPLNLSNADIDSEVWLEKSRFGAPVTFNFAKFKGSISLEFSVFDDAVSMSGAHVANMVSIVGATFEKSLDMSSMQVGIHVMGGQKTLVKEDFSLFNTDIQGSLIFNEARFQGKVWMNNVRARTDSAITDSEFDSEVVMDQASFGSALVLDNSSFAADVSATFLEVDETFSLRSANFAGALDLYATEVGQNIELNDATFAGQLRLSNIRAAGSLNLIGSVIHGKLLFSNMQIGGQLQLKRVTLHDHSILQDSQINDGVFITNSQFRAKFTAIGMKTSGQMLIRKSKFLGPFDLDNAVVSRALIIRSSELEETFALTNLSVGGQLEIVDSVFFKEIKMSGASLSGNFWIEGAILKSDLFANRTSVGGDLMLKNLRAEKDFLFRQSHIGGETFVDSSQFFENTSFSGTRFDDSVYVFKSLFDGELLLMYSIVAGSLYSSETIFNADVDLRGSQISGRVALSDKSEFRANLNLDRVLIGQELYLNEAKYAKEVSIKDAMLKGTVQMERSLFAGDVSFDFTIVEDNIFLGPKSEFRGEFSIASGSVAKQLVFDTSSFRGNVSLDSIEAGTVLLGPQSTFDGEVSLGYARVFQEISMSQSIFIQPLILAGVDIGQVLILGDGATLEAGISIDGATVRGDVEVMESRIGVLSLTGTSVEGALYLGYTDEFEGDWTDNAIVDLSNSKIGVLQVPFAWQTSIKLDGLVYEQLGGDFVGNQPMLARDSQWFIDFLELESDYSPQPYKQLADKLKQNGQPDKANDVLYSGKERERRQAGWLSWIWLTSLKYAIGYGFGNYIFRVCYWILFFVLVGGVVTWLDSEGRGKGRGPLWSLFYSFDRLLPIIELSKEHGEIEMLGPGKYYYYWHVLAGYVLALFLVAGISGLTSA